MGNKLFTCKLALLQNCCILGHMEKGWPREFSSQSLFRSAVALPALSCQTNAFLMAEYNLFQIGIMRRRWRQIQCAQVFILPGLVYFNTHIMHTTYMYLCAEQWGITHKCDFVTINVLAKEPGLFLAYVVRPYTQNKVGDLHVWDHRTFLPFFIGSSFHLE